MRVLSAVAVPSPYTSTPKNGCLPIDQRRTRYCRANRHGPCRHLAGAGRIATAGRWRRYWTPSVGALPRLPGLAESVGDRDPALSFWLTPARSAAGLQDNPWNPWRTISRLLTSRLRGQVLATGLLDRNFGGGWRGKDTIRLHQLTGAIGAARTEEGPAD